MFDAFRMGLFLFFYIVLRSIYLQIALGAIIMGLGVLKVFQEKKFDTYNRRVPKQDDEHKNAREDGSYRRMNKKVLSKDLQVVVNIVATDESNS